MFGFALNISNRAVFGSGVPVAVAATTVTDTSFVANWNAYPNAINYLLDVSLSSDFSTYVLQNQPVYDTFFTVTGLISNTTYYYRVRAELNYDTDAQAFFTRVTTAGGSLTVSEQISVNALVLDMKYAGVWSSMKAVYPMVGSSAAACAQNLKSSSFTGSFTSGWTFASTGATPNGSSAYMNTNLVPSSELSQNSLHLSYYSRTNNTKDAVEIGAFGPTGTTQSQILINFTNQNNDASNNSPSSITRTWDTTGLFVVTRTISSEYKSFRNGSNIITRTISSSGNVDKSIWVGGRNNDGVYTDRQCAFASIGNGLTDAETSKFYTTVQSFQTRLARQIGAPVVADADAQAFINRVYTAGGTVSLTEATAVNKLVGNLKAANLWNKMKAIYPMVGASAAACAQNLRSSSFTGSFSSGWTFASGGATPDGVSAFMNTNLNPSTELSINLAHLSSYNTQNPNSGMLLSNGNLSCFLQYSGAQLYGGLANTSFIVASASQTASFVMVNRPSSSTIKVIRNNTIITSSTSNTGSAYASANIEIGRYGTGFYQSATFAFASIGDGMSDTEASDFYTHIQTFQTSLSRQV